MNFTTILFYSLIAGLSTILGTAMVFYKESWTRKNSIFLISFASGIMLTISFLYLLPEANKLFDNVWIITFGSFLVFYFLQDIVMFHPCYDEQCELHKIGLLSFIGLCVHSLLDGIAITVGFETNWSLGILTTIAVLLHEIPEGIVITGILFHSNMTKTKVWIHSIIVAVATPIGAAVSYLFLQNISKDVLGFLLSLTAGSFIYLVATDLLPETHKKHHRANAIFFFLGVGIIIFIGKILH